MEDSTQITKPQIFSSASNLPVGTKIVEAYNGALKELFFVRNPKLKKTMSEAAAPLAKFLENHGIGEIWVYYPWSTAAVHTIEESAYFELRTARNRQVITKEEQEKYRNAYVGIAGLSVGSAVVSALCISGGPKKIKIADFDEVEISNLNRIRAKLTDIGNNKTHVAARETWELDPFADLELWDKGVSKETLEEFILNPRLDIFVDEMDSIDLKIMSRLICRKNKMPVLMATDNGDSVILDVERFDLEPEREIFHGLIGDMTIEDAKNLPFTQWLQLATRIVGPEYLTETMQRSLIAIGSEISSVPQLGTTANLAGTVCSYAIRRIANGEEMPSGRYVIGCEEKMVPDYHSDEQKQKRSQNLEKFKNHFIKK